VDKSHLIAATLGAILVVGIQWILRARSPSARRRAAWREASRLDGSFRSYVELIVPDEGYPPDKQAKATQSVLEQAALLSEAWAA